MDIHPINQIEDEKAWRDMGKQGLLMLRGAMDEGANLTEGTASAVRFLCGFGPRCWKG